MTRDSFTTISFRDPAGFVFEHEGEIRRQINPVYREHYDRLMASGLYAELVERGLLVPHEELDTPADPANPAYKIIRPEVIEFISYPYEWCFSQYRDAALTALEIERRALEHGMTLKDCTAYNVQFRHGRPTWIDTLSFETYVEGEPWVAYRQFCEHFLAPLALMSLVDHRLGKLCQTNLDGIPLDLAARLLPWRTRLRWGLGVHLHLHASLQRTAPKSASPAPTASRHITKQARLGLVDSLESTIRGLPSNSRNDGWAAYYHDNTYSVPEIEHKAQLVASFLDQTHARTAWDLGANTGRFSRIASERGISTISFDFDPACVEHNYQECRQRDDTKMLPLVLDLFNPSPSIGWANTERFSIFQRGHTDLVMALALIHHLAFTGNQPLNNLAEFFSSLSRHLVIEFVPETDSQAVSLTASRRGIHHPYNREYFETCFSKHFSIIQSEPVSASGRRLYLMRRNDD
jgi:hypothetical protein